MSHFIEYCKYCKTIITQCRCPAKDKEVRYGVCSKCSKAKPSSINNMHIEIAEDTLVQKFEDEVQIILYMLGHPEALVTDLSTLGDFQPSQGLLDKLSELFTFRVTNQSYIANLAVEIHDMFEALRDE